MRLFSPSEAVLGKKTLAIRSRHLLFSPPRNYYSLFVKKKKQPFTLSSKKDEEGKEKEKCPVTEVRNEESKLSTNTASSSVFIWREGRGRRPFLCLYNAGYYFPPVRKPRGKSGVDTRLTVFSDYKRSENTWRDKNVSVRYP